MSMLIFGGFETAILFVVLIQKFWPWLIGVGLVALAYWFGRHKVSITIKKRG